MKKECSVHNSKYVLWICTCLLVISYPYAEAQSIKYPTQEIEPYYDLAFTRAERDSLLKNLQDNQNSLKALHAYTLPNGVPMSLVFDPTPIGFVLETNQRPIDWSLPKDLQVPPSPSDLAFLPVHKLAVLIKSRKITSTQLTQLYINRLKKYSDTLHCSIALLESYALQKAKQADDEIARGKYRGPLHGIPFGIKDLLAVEGTKTTWGATPYKDQEIAETATVVRKLEEAGAVLLVKLTMGALAMGDIWYGGVTRNPWDLTLRQIRR